MSDEDKTASETLNVPGPATVRAEVEALANPPVEPVEDPTQQQGMDSPPNDPLQPERDTFRDTRDRGRKMKVKDDLYFRTMVMESLTRIEAALTQSPELRAGLAALAAEPPKKGKR